MVVTASTPVPLHERIYRTEAIVLNRLDYREADRIITVYTPERGKIRLIAKGVRRPLSRLGPHLEYFTRCHLMLAAGRELDTVTGAETLDAHLGLRADLDAFGHASHMVEVLNRLTEDREEHHAVFDLLGSSLRLLADGLDAFVVTRHYEWALLTLLGFRPQLYHCLHCQNELVAEPNAFSSRLGGMLCPRCRTADSGSREISINAQKFLRGLDRQGLAFVARLPLNDALRADIEGVMAAYLRHVAAADLRSLNVWRAIRNPERT
ncbi:MAG: DNA repair protein RecO [Chloroflexia bacterium]|nr:DNA repair protein RecO [Chloroflexia bacterium]